MFHQVGFCPSCSSPVDYTVTKANLGGSFGNLFSISIDIQCSGCNLGGRIQESQLLYKD